jgi:hypothetical protein
MRAIQRLQTNQRREAAVPAGIEAGAGVETETATAEMPKMWVATTTLLVLRPPFEATTTMWYLLFKKHAKMMRVRRCLDVDQTDSSIILSSARCNLADVVSSTQMVW